MTLFSHLTHLEKLVKALLYLVMLLCLPEPSVYASSTQKQAADHVCTELIFSHAQPSGKSISYSQALVKFRERTSSYADHQFTLIQLSLLHNRNFKIAFAHMSKQDFGYASHSYFYQLKTIPQSSADLPAYLSSRG